MKLQELNLMFDTCCLHGLISDPDDGDSRVLRNVGDLIQGHTALHPSKYFWHLLFLNSYNDLTVVRVIRGLNPVFSDSMEECWHQTATFRVSYYYLLLFLHTQTADTSVQL